jgi:uncharacterized phage protein (TIGR01671 family)
MNREIKFRAWDKSCNKMRGISGLQDCFSLRSDGVCNEDYILLQYTGLKDKNGKEIYEGDILKSKSGNLFTCVFYGAGFKLSQNNGKKVWSSNNTSTLEFIGNIYENPEFTQSSE